MVSSIVPSESLVKIQEINASTNELPVEIIHTIFDYLDGHSLLSAAMVSHKWLAICKSRMFLRRKIRICIARKNLSFIIGVKTNDIELVINE